MLVLSRKQGTEIKIGQDVTIRILSVRGGQVKIGVEAPSEQRILRGELKPKAA